MIISHHFWDSQVWMNVSGQKNTNTLSSFTKVLGFRVLKFFRMCAKLLKLSHVDLLLWALPHFLKGLGFRVLNFFQDEWQTLKVHETGWATRPVELCSPVTQSFANFYKRSWFQSVEIFQDVWQNGHTFRVMIWKSRWNQMTPATSWKCMLPAPTLLWNRFASKCLKSNFKKSASLT